MKTRSKTIILVAILALLLAALALKSFLEFKEDLPIEVAQSDTSALDLEPSAPQRHVLSSEPEGANELMTTTEAPETKDEEPILGPSPKFQVTGPSGKPIPGARVFWRDRGRPSTLDSAEMDYVIQSASWGIEAYGVSSGFCDDEGCLTIPDCRGGLEVWADAPGFSCRWSRDFPALELHAARVTVVLFKDLGISVQLKSDLGQSLNAIPVGFLRRQSGSGLAPDLISLAFSNESGELSLIGPYEDLPFVGFEYFLCLLFPLVEPVELIINPFGDTKSVHELRVPPYGAMRMQVAEVDQHRLKPGQIVSIYPASRFRRSGFNFDDHGLKASYEATGQLLFRPIGLGLSLTLQAADDDNELQRLPFPSGRSRDILGPTVADQVLDFGCPAGPAEHRFRFRVLDQRGQPLPRQAIELESEDGSLEDFLCSDAIYLDAESRAEFAIRQGLEIDLHAEDQQEEEGFEVSVQLVEDPNRSDDRPRCAFKLPVQPWPELVDLGDLILEPPPLLVSGKVVDQAGEGIPFALLEWSHVWDKCQLPAINYWLHCSDREGSFRIGEWPAQEKEVETEPPSLGLWAWAPGYLLQFKALPDLPTDDVELRLRPSWPVELEIKLNEGIKAKGLLLEFSGMAVEAWIKDAGTKLFDERYHFVKGIESSRMKLDNIGPGALQIRVKFSEFRGVELMRANYTIPKEPQSDPLILELDLRNAIRFSDLKVASEEGDILSNASLRWRDPTDLSNAHVFHEEPDYAGRISLPSDLLRRDCVLVCGGFEAKHFEGAPPSGTLVLKRARRIVLNVTAGDQDMEAEGLYLWSTHPLLGEVLAEVRGPLASIALPEPGRYHFGLFNTNRPGLEFGGVEVEYRGDESQLKIHFPIKE